MQVSNDIHFSSDAYLISKKQYETEHKSESEFESFQSDISTVKLEEKSYAKSINALQPLQVVTDKQISNSESIQASNSNNTEKALDTYAKVENTSSSQDYFNQIKEMV